LLCHGEAVLQHALSLLGEDGSTTGDV
jgi:hypothetical protein